MSRGIIIETGGKEETKLSEVRARSNYRGRRCISINKKATDPERGTSDKFSSGVTSKKEKRGRDGSFSGRPGRGSLRKETIW